MPSCPRSATPRASARFPAGGRSPGRPGSVISATARNTSAHAARVPKPAAPPATTRATPNAASAQAPSWAGAIPTTLVSGPWRTHDSACARGNWGRSPGCGRLHQPNSSSAPSASASIDRPTSPDSGRGSAISRALIVRTVGASGGSERPRLSPPCTRIHPVASWAPARHDCSMANPAPTAMVASRALRVPRSRGCSSPGSSGAGIRWRQARQSGIAAVSRTAHPAPSGATEIDGRRDPTRTATVSAPSSAGPRPAVPAVVVSSRAPGTQHVRASSASDDRAGGPVMRHRASTIDSQESDAARAAMGASTPVTVLLVVIPSRASSRRTGAGAEATAPGAVDRTRATASHSGRPRTATLRPARASTAPSGTGRTDAPGRNWITGVAPLGRNRGALPRSCRSAPPPTRSRRTTRSTDRPGTRRAGSRCAGTGSP
jgi:hypothetical protein